MSTYVTSHTCHNVMSLQEQIATSVGYPHCDWDLDDITAISHTSHNMMSLQDRIVISLQYHIQVTLWRGLKRHRCDITYMSQCNVTTRANCDISGISHCDWDLDDITAISHTSHNMMSLQDRIVTSLWYRIPVTLWRRLTRYHCDVTYLSHCDCDLEWQKITLQRRNYDKPGC